jgi:hypothetical protein
MSLIVDIDPVPWNILEVVKCRILKNRAKAKRAVENCGGSEEKRADSLRPGPLSTRKKDEPSFVLSGDTPYIAIVTGGQYGRRVVVGLQDQGGYEYFGDFYMTTGPFAGLVQGQVAREQIEIYKPIQAITLKLNGIAVGNVEPPGLDTFIAYLFVWSEDFEKQTEIKNKIKSSYYLNKYEPHEQTNFYSLSGYTFQPNPNTPYLINLEWKVILIGSDKINEPQAGDKINVDWVPENSISYGMGEGKSPAPAYFGFAESQKINKNTFSTAISRPFNYVFEFSDD